LKGAPLRAGHLRGSQAQIGNLLSTDRLRNSPEYTLPEYHISSSLSCVEFFSATLPGSLNYGYPLF
jgi:hypothetical protein